jgi:hypothetical protein
MGKHIEFISKSKPSKYIVGSGLAGYVQTTRRHLEGCFGPPLDSKYIDQYKTTAEWHVEIKHDGDIVGAVAIYDYKSDSSDNPDEEIHWHLGCKTKNLALEITDFITTNNKRLSNA